MDDWINKICYIRIMEYYSASKGKEEGGGGGVMNWEIGIDMYTLMCIKWMTNKKK